MCCEITSIQHGQPLTRGDTVNISIEDGVTIGSTTTAVNSILFGEWPNGITINLTNNGIVVGKGGAGGSGGRVLNNYSIATPGNGSNGGDAIDFSQPNNPTINLINNNLIGSGGGGGGGSKGNFDEDDDFENFSGNW